MKGYDNWKTTNPADEELGPEAVKDSMSETEWQAEYLKIDEKLEQALRKNENQATLITNLADAAAAYLSFDGSDKIYDAVKLQGARVKLRAEIQSAIEATK